MTRTRAQFFPGPEFNAFLYAPLGEEQNGMELSMVSALARVGMDPWQEAARLAALPRDAAIDGLARLLGRLPGRQSVDTAATAARLVTLLPQRGSPGTQPDQATTGVGKKTGLVAAVLILIALALAVASFG
jgi:hypothetical protein